MSSHGSESPPDASGGPENARLAPASAPGRRPPPSAERAFQALIEGLPQRIFVKDRDSVYVTSNELFASEYGLTPEKLAGLTDFDLGPAADADRYRREDRRVFEERRPIRTEQSMAAGEMTRVVQWVKAPILDEQDQPVGLIGVSIEASEYKRAALELQKSEMEFKLIWEHCLDGMRLMDGEGNVLLVNDAFCRMCGKTRDELVGHSFTVIYEESRREEILVHFKDRFAARDIEPMFEQELAMWHGGRIWFELSNSFIEVEDRVPHLLSIFRDITERRLSE